MLDLDLQEKFRHRRDELNSLDQRRTTIVNELNELAQKVEYGEGDYDAQKYWRHAFQDIAYAGGLGFYSHQVGSAYTFWIPSAQSC